MSLENLDRWSICCSSYVFVDEDCCPNGEELETSGDGDYLGGAVTNDGGNVVGAAYDKSFTCYNEEESDSEHIYGNDNTNIELLNTTEFIVDTESYKDEHNISKDNITYEEFCDGYKKQDVPQDGSSWVYKLPYQSYGWAALRHSSDIELHSMCDGGITKENFFHGKDSTGNWVDDGYIGPLQGGDSDDTSCIGNQHHGSDCLVCQDNDNVSNSLYLPIVVPPPLQTEEVNVSSNQFSGNAMSKNDQKENKHTANDAQDNKTENLNGNSCKRNTDVCYKNSNSHPNRTASSSKYSNYVPKPNMTGTSNESSTLSQDMDKKGEGFDKKQNKYKKNSSGKGKQWNKNKGNYQKFSNQSQKNNQQYNKNWNDKKSQDMDGSNRTNNWNNNQSKNSNNLIVMDNNQEEKKTPANPVKAPFGGSQFCNYFKNSADLSNSGNNFSDKNKMKDTGKSTTNSGISERLFDVLKLLKWLVIPATKNRCISPVDSWIIQLHYIYGHLFFKICFIIFRFGWFFREEIVCISFDKGSKVIDNKILNICLTYPYVTIEDSVKFLAFYRWLYWTFLMEAALFYLPRHIMKKFEEPRLKRLLQDLELHSPRYDTVFWEKDEETMISYLERNVDGHNLHYAVFVFGHMCCICCVIVTAFFYDFTLQGNFLSLPVEAYPFDRYIPDFTDHISIAFPPFAFCTVGPNQKMNNARSETYGCHLTFMELYDKVFLIMWIVLAVLFVCGFLSTLCLLLAPFPPFRFIVLWSANSSCYLRKLKLKLAHKYSFGDLFVLYLIKRCISDKQFCRLIEKIAVEEKENNNSASLQDIVVDYPKRSSTPLPGVEPHDESVCFAEIQRELDTLPRKRVTESQKLLLE